MSFIVSITENEKQKYIGPFRPNDKKPFFKSAQQEFDYNETQIKKCSKCKIEKSKNHFNFNTSGSDAFDKNGYRLRRPECIECSKKILKGKQLARKNFGSHKPPKDAVCELCGKNDKLVFDHDHSTNTFRGWLCDPCNRSIGMLGDSIPNFFSIILYLSKDKIKDKTIIQRIINLKNDITLIQNEPPGVKTEEVGEPTGVKTEEVDEPTGVKTEEVDKPTGVKTEEVDKQT